MKLALAFALGLLLGAFGMAGQWDHQAAEITSQIERDVEERRELRPEDALLFSVPIQYDVSIMQSGHGIDEPKLRYYKARKQ